MAQLTVVRHGQASFLSDNYDKLSALGEEQARRLAGYWIEHGVRFDVVAYGPRERQIRTGEIIREIFERRGLGWPEPVSIAEFDEYPAEPVVKTFAPGLAAKYADFAEWAAIYANGGEEAARRRALDLIVRETTRKWMEGEVGDAEQVGTWDEFVSRVRSGVEMLRQRTPKSGRSAVFTSGGPSAVTAGIALDLTPAKVFDLVWMKRNAAVSEYVFSGERFSLSVFNSTPHLEGSLLTYR
jgi:broad specificity phosphatase PhoE